MKEMPKLVEQVERHPYPLLFATVSGAHLYGFPSADSDFDLRGIHVLPVEDVVGLSPLKETVDATRMEDGLEIDLVTHDVKKFFGLMQKKNGYVLEQVTSPLVVHSTPEHEELKRIAAKCVTRHHWHHYNGFAATQWKLIQSEDPPRVKPLLYLYRVLMTGIHMMRTGEVEANLRTLNDTFQLSFLDDLIARKVEGAEKEPYAEYDATFHSQMYEKLCADLHEAAETTHLPEGSQVQPQLNDLLVRVRLSGLCPSAPPSDGG